MRVESRTLSLYEIQKKVEDGTIVVDTDYQELKRHGWYYAERGELHRLSSQRYPVALYFGICR